MNRFLRAIGAGVVATAAMMAIFLFTQVQTRSRLGAPEAIARFVGVPGHLYVGLVVFIAVGIFVWPVVFAVVQDRLADVPGGTDVAVRGLVFGAVLWILFLILGTEELVWPFVVLYLAFTLLGHLAYGFTLGLIYQRFA